MRKVITTLSTVVVALFCGCITPRTDQASDHAGVRMAVLAHMVTNADAKGKLVCFVDLQPTELERLLDLTGHRFLIAQSDESEFTDQGVRLKRSKREGVLIKVEVANVHNGMGEAFGSYNQGTSLGFAGFRYRLRYTLGAWHVVSSECTVAS